VCDSSSFIGLLCSTFMARACVCNRGCSRKTWEITIKVWDSKIVSKCTRRGKEVMLFEMNNFNFNRLILINFNFKNNFIWFRFIIYSC